MLKTDDDDDDDEDDGDVCRGLVCGYLAMQDLGAKMIIRSGVKFCSITKH